MLLQGILLRRDINVAVRVVPRLYRTFISEVRYILLPWTDLKKVKEGLVFIRIVIILEL